MTTAQEVLDGRAAWAVECGDCLDLVRRLPTGCVDAVVTDPPYGMGWDTDSKRFTGGNLALRRGEGRDDWGPVRGDEVPFDPSPWLPFPRVVLWGANHFAARLPVGTTLVWLKKADHLFGTFLSDAEVGWMKGGHGVYCHREQFPPPSRMAEGDGRVLHPNQKPVGLMRWCLGRLRLGPGALVLDPYCGSGTTGVVAVRMGFRFIGMEVDPDHAAVARKRIESDAPLFNAAPVPPLAPGLFDTLAQEG
jgi:site-specific DNA-methyltransferase (adenine-specific)